MATVARCPGCHKDFKSLAAHQSRCPELLRALQNGPTLKRKHQEEQEAKRVRQKKEAARQAAEQEIRDQEAANERARREAEWEAAQPVIVESYSRAGRQRRAPARIRDMLPTSLAGLPEHIPRPPPRAPPQTHIPEISTDEPVPTLDSLDRTGTPPAPDLPMAETPPNRFGVFRRYSQTSPLRDPEEDLTIDDFTDNPNHSRAPSDPVDPLRPFGTSVLGQAAQKAQNLFAPFLNITVFRLMHWLHSGSALKSAGELTRLVREVLLPSEYSRDHIRQFDADRENKRLDHYSAAASGPFSPEDGWREGSVKIPLPKERHRHASESDAPTYDVENIFYRPLLEVIKAAYQEPGARRFHWFPFHYFWRSSRSDPTSESPGTECLYTDIYNSDAMLQEHEKIQAKARTQRHPEDEDHVEYIVAPILIYSDSTHLTNFGSAALWPIYVFFGGLSKYIRARPTTFSAHHLAYIPSLPSSIQAAYQSHYGEPASAAVLRFCKRELMQGIWLLLLHDDFMHAYEHGTLVQCGDGIVRRIFPRLFAYSADYPEKCLIACLKHLARCPCPDCLVDEDKVSLMGTVNDLKHRESHARKDTHTLRYDIASARRKIFEHGAPVEGAHVEAVLGMTSSTPTRSAFSVRLAEFGFNVYTLFVPDLMHEFELGVWKSTFTHLIRILVAAGGAAVQTLDARFAQIPTFGSDTIRRFGSNVSAMKKLAARDFEDLVQCAIPAFESLLTLPFDKIVLDLLFILATWHALAKLRLHTETTIGTLEHYTRALRQTMRLFAREVCAAFETQELPKETVARHRRKAATASKGKKKATTGARSTAKRTRKNFNLITYKYHRLGDYPRVIRLLGPTDNYTTQVGELEHRRVKRFYARTNKNATFVRQIAQHQRREALLHRIAQQHSSSGSASKPSQRSGHKHDHASVASLPSNPPTSLRLDTSHTEALGATPPKEHYHISDDQRHHVNMYDFVSNNHEDRATEDFVLKLKKHVLGEMTTPHTTEHAAENANNLNSCRDPSREDIDGLRFRLNRLYLHKVLRVNYTSYDMRREVNSINPRTHPDVMMLAPAGEDHPYLYARILSIFHVNAYRLGSIDPEPQRIPVLWVRWMDVDLATPAGFTARRPYRVKFAHADEPDAFGFLSPESILRAVHLIPAFHHGRGDNGLLGSSVARPDGRSDDWKFHYVGMWSDRDLFMRYLGGAVGHQQGPAVQPSEDIDSDSDSDMAELESHRESAESSGLENPLTAESDDEEPDIGYEPSESDSDSDSSGRSDDEKLVGSPRSSREDSDDEDDGKASRSSQEDLEDRQDAATGSMGDYDGEGFSAL